ncbi:Ctf8-domain-containing protein [Chiua virens]|nr:Ctf8-domain-containing protein [Chiua virens]
MFPTTLTTLFHLFTFFDRPYPQEQPHIIKHEPPRLQFELRHQHAVSSDAHILFTDIPQVPTSALTGGYRTTYTLTTKRTTSFRPASFHAHEAARLRSIRHAQSSDLPWWEDEITAPDVDARETLLELAKMGNNAYITPDDAAWYELGDHWDDPYRFGWEQDDDGLRGHVFATPDNATVVLSIKGTSAAIFGTVVARGSTGRGLRCHLGKSIVYDTVSNLSWAVDVRTHGIVSVIENILSQPWQACSEVGREVPEAKPETDCVECFTWEFGDFPPGDMIVPIAITQSNAFSPKLAPCIAQLGHDELFLIELQGTLDVQGLGSESASGKDGQLIGTLSTADMNKPTLVIGHHLLEGKVVSLPKPLGVLHKHVRKAVAAHHSLLDDASEGEDEGEKKKGEGEVRWDVIAVVKKKIVFSKRPMPMAAKPASTASRRRTST